MKALRFLVAGLFALSMIVFGGVSAQAVTGGNITNDCNSYPTALRAYYNTSNGAYWNIYDCQTTKGSSIAGKVQGFRIPTNCDGKSQYTPATGGYPYKGGVYYPYSQNNLDLVIKVVCNA